MTSPCGGKRLGFVARGILVLQFQRVRVILKLRKYSGSTVFDGENTFCPDVIGVEFIQFISHSCGYFRSYFESLDVVFADTRTIDCHHIHAFFLAVYGLGSVE